MKKIAMLALVLISCLCLLLSCSWKVDDPIDVAEQLDEEDYYVNLLVDNTDIKDFANTFEIKSRLISGIVIAIPEAEGDEVSKTGIFIYCEKTDDAKDMEEDLIDLFEKKDDDDAVEFLRGIVVREGKVVFFGCEDVWEVFE